MSVTFTQSDVASFGDRPVLHGVGLRVECTTGGNGVVLEHRLLAPAGKFHSRLMFNADTISNGQVTLLAGLDAASIPHWSLRFNSDMRTLTLDMGSIGSIASTPLNALAWHCVEVMIDVPHGAAKLWIDGKITGTLTSTFTLMTTLNTLTFELGCITKENACTGAYSMDEWIISDDYIGPVLVDTQSDFANDPSRWLLIYNTANANSIAWTEHYRRLRNIPWSNLLGLELPLTETINPDAFAAMSDAINEYLQLNRLSNRILGILIGFGVPGYVDFSGIIEPLGALLHSSGNSSGLVFNPLAADFISISRPTPTNTSGLRLTARIDAPDLQTAIAWIDRAKQISNQNPGDGSDATIFLNPYITLSDMTAPSIDEMVQWSASIERMQTHLPIVLSDPNGTSLNAGFSSIQNDGFFWGWVTASPSSNFFSSTSTNHQRLFCCPLDLDNATAPTLRDATDTHWLMRAIQAGYAGAAGNTGSSNVSVLPRVEIFFAALRHGWTLAEAWFLASPFLRHRWFLAGDPLQRVNMPKQGWKLLGPATRLEEIEPDQPSMAFRASETQVTLPATLHGPSGQTAVYLIRARDAMGRLDMSAGSNVIRTTVLSSQAKRFSRVDAIWPDQENWQNKVEFGQLQLTIFWADAVKAAKISSVELWSAVDSVEAICTTLTPKKFSRSLTAPVPLPTQPTKFRWKTNGIEGDESFTPWSATFVPNPNNSLALTLLEIK